MALSFTDLAAPETAYPLTSFYFAVQIDGIDESSFQEVTGIGSELETEDVVEGGENRFVHTLPTKPKHSRLVLKRGVVVRSSPLIRWCRKILDSDFGLPIDPKLINVYLFNEKREPVRGWTFADAYPVKWEIGDFHSGKNEIAIETITLSYTRCNRNDLR